MTGGVFDAMCERLCELSLRIRYSMEQAQGSAEVSDEERRAFSRFADALDAVILAASEVERFIPTQERVQ